MEGETVAPDTRILLKQIMGFSLAISPPNRLDTFYFRPPFQFHLDLEILTKQFLVDF